MGILRALIVVSLGFSWVHAAGRVETNDVQKPAGSQNPTPAKSSAPPAESKVEPAALPGMQKPPETEEEEPSKNSEEVEEKETAGPSSQESMMYEVKKGDTLWDLAANFYQEPFDWKRIWEGNKNNIRNPDLIYPRQRFVIPGRMAAMRPVPEKQAETEETSEETPEAAESSGAPERSSPSNVAVPEKTGGAYSKTTPDSIIEARNWRGDGQIVSDLSRKIMISQHDVVYVNVGASKGATPRMRAEIYRKGEAAWDPSVGSTVGVVYKRVGVIEMTKDVGDDMSSAVVVSSNEPLKTGDIVKLRN